eukprot:CAMPEP_0118979364 /NCGR_PEP_ID=MMETSP1173-20130426/25785_1 /TAXON_ID=1034831 /ORGANISM="Rhizochromulina marina cf, Strain CCMP1243" /LENGTH=52 /DNA_ID=CAMNT_0006929621 /DNA_START=566 /DNA_END=724 /DNA_ORIENTATION=+
MSWSPLVGVAGVHLHLRIDEDSHDGLVALLCSQVERCIALPPTKALVIRIHI